VDLVREYRVWVSQRPTNRGRLPEPATLNDLHRLLMTFLRWAEDEGYAVDPRMRRLKAPRVPLKEATELHIAQLRDVLAACNPVRPQEELIRSHTGREWGASGRALRPGGARSGRSA
jgi:hypothetical protein